MPLFEMIRVISVIMIQALVGIEILVRVEILIEVMEGKVEDRLVVPQVVPLMEVLLVVIEEGLDFPFLGEIMVTMGQEVVEALEVQVEEEEVVPVVVRVEGVPPLLPLLQVVAMSTTGDS